MSFFRFDSTIGRSLREYGEWAQVELNFLFDFVEPGSTIIDIGAFIGTHTLAFSQIVGLKGTVYAFEPQLSAFQLLSSNVKQNAISNVRLFNTALSDIIGSISLSDFNPAYKDNLGSFSLKTVTKSITDDNDKTTINLETLDKYEVEKCDLIKIDVEGMEYKVLKGAEETIHHFHPLVFAECLSLDEGWKVILLMRDKGYKAFLHNELAYNPFNFNNNPNTFLDDARETNILFIPDYELPRFQEKIKKVKTLIPCNTLDDLALGLLKKPQYKYEVLSKTDASQVLGTGFFANESELQQFTNGLQAKDIQLNILSNNLEEKDNEVKELDQALKVQDIQIAAQSSEIKEKNLKIESQNVEIYEKNHKLAAQSSEINEKILKIESQSSEINEKSIQLDRIQLQIQQSIVMQLQSKYQRVIEKVLRQNTRRRFYYELLLSGIRVILKEGFQVFLKKAVYWFRYYRPFLRRRLYTSNKNKTGINLNNKLSLKKEFSNTDDSIKSHDSLQSEKSELMSDSRYFNSLMEQNTEKGPEFVSISYPIIPETDIKLIAYYLPQFHPIPENDEWWGKGFTEWTNVARAIPQFVGHYQPRLPGELGFYDLRIQEIQRRQVELAKQYGTYGFCFHFYWFNGKTLLEMPLDRFASDPEINMEFCISWANENWSRRWDGLDNELLIQQNHSPQDDLSFIEYVSKYIKNKRYIKINDRPLLIVYRPELLPEPAKTAQRWRKWCRENGVGEIHLALTHSFVHTDPRNIGFDSAIEFAPNTFPLLDIKDQFEIVNGEFQGHIFDYTSALTLARNYIKPEYIKFRGLCPNWDNEARKPGKGTVLANATPEKYGIWLKDLCNFTTTNFAPSERLIFINAWNEWAEGAYLEPDRRYGYAYLNKTAEILSLFPKGYSGIQLPLTSDEDKELKPNQPDSIEDNMISKRSRSKPMPGVWKILFVSHDACRGGSQTVLLNTIMWFKKHTFIDFKILCLEGGEWLPRFSELGDTLELSQLRKKTIDGDALINHIITFCGGLPDLIYGNSVASGKEYRLLSRLNVPIITHFHELETSIKRYASDYIPDIIKYSSHFIACSNSVAKNLTSNYGVKGAEISVVFSGIDHRNSVNILSDPEKQRLRKKLRLDQDKIIIFGCGIGMAFRKGADLFIKAAQTLRGKGYDNFHFYWIGEFEGQEFDSQQIPWSEHLSELKKEGLDKYVTFLGFKNDAREYLPAGDIFLMPSREEPVGLVSLEAAECGLPIVCFADSGGMPDFIEQDAGLVIPFENIEAMADGLETLLKDKDLRLKMGARAREKLLSGFTTEQLTPKILSACRSIASKKPGVSVIVPNYNHVSYLPRRLDSIFSQTYKDFEIFLLDDASTDSSVKLLEKYANYADMLIMKNEQNTGSPFKQWLKGIDLATADLIWIAESDDASESRFLETVIPAFQDPEVKLAYANSYIIDENDKVIGDYTNGEYLSSLSDSKWKNSYKVSSIKEINDGLGVKDTILNASAMIFRKLELDPQFRQTLGEMRIAGDWYFIVNAIKNGKIQYEVQKLNYHRRHSESVVAKIVSNKRVNEFYRDFYIVHKYVCQNYGLDYQFYEKWDKYMRQQWKDFYPNVPFEEIKKYYSVDEIKRDIGKSVKYQNMTDEQWLAALSGELSIPGVPELPDEQTQLNFTGASGRKTLVTAFDFYMIAKNTLRSLGKPIDQETKILDFGCGWGRITRFFLKDCKNSNLFGVDPLPEMIRLCKDKIPANFLLISPAPPINFEDSSFDLITAYSVFSHLNEEYTNKWLDEFHRILKPRSVLIITTRSRTFINYCSSLDKQSVPQHAIGIVNCFKNPEKYLIRYDSGEFVHQATGAGDVLLPDFFGESCIPEKYFHRFSKQFEIINFIEFLPDETTQACAILRKIP
jgi:FkbM family methyltransferase